LNQGIPVSVVVLFAGGITLTQMQENGSIPAPVAYLLGAALVGWTLRIWKRESQ
jgi:hypothetical protein